MAKYLISAAVLTVAMFTTLHHDDHAFIFDQKGLWERTHTLWALRPIVSHGLVGLECDEE